MERILRRFAPWASAAMVFVNNPEQISGAQLQITIALWLITDLCVFCGFSLLLLPRFEDAVEWCLRCAAKLSKAACEHDLTNR